MAIPEISVEELAERLDGPIALIDVREPHEYEAGHVAGARLVPLGSVPDELETLRALAPLTIICQAGARSMKAAEFLAGHGIEATNVAGGTGNWIVSGREVITGDQPSAR